MSDEVTKSGKDWTYIGPTTSDGVRFAARAFAILKLLKTGAAREPTEAEIEAEMSEAAKRLGVGVA